MRILDALLGNASATDKFAVQSDIHHFLMEDELVENSYRVIRDLFVFTNYRLLIIDKQGATGKKTSYHSISYDNISHFTVETAGLMDVESKLIIHMIGGKSFMQVFSRDNTIGDVQLALANHCYKKK